MDSTIQVLEGLNGAPVVAEEVNGLGYTTLAQYPGVGAFDLKTWYAAHKKQVQVGGVIVALGLGFILYKKGKLPFLRRRATSIPFPSFAGLGYAPRRRKARRSRRSRR